MRCVTPWLCAMAACVSLTACGLPADGRVRPARALSNGPVAAAFPDDDCPAGTFSAGGDTCLQTQETRKQIRQQLAAETIRIRTESQGK